MAAKALTSVVDILLGFLGVWLAGQSKALTFTRRTSNQESDNKSSAQSAFVVLVLEAWVAIDGAHATGVNIEVELTMSLVVVVVLDIGRGTTIGACAPPMIVEIEL